MDFNLSKEEELLRRSAREFLAREVPSDLVKEMAVDERGYPPELWKKMAGLGWMGLGVSEAHGGTGGSFLELAVLLEEIGRACLPGPFVASTVLGASTIVEAGSDRQKKDYLPKISEGDLILTLALTEADAGCDPDSIKVKATTDGNDFVINGTKLFVPDAHVADYVICVARTRDGGTDGITLFLVDAKSPGLSQTPLQTLAGNKLSEVVFDGVRVPQACVLGQVDGGWIYMEKVLAKAAVAMCAQMVGAAQHAMEMAVEHSKVRVQFGRPVGSFQAVQFHCADMLMDIDGGRLITHKAASKISEGVACAMEVAIAKAWVSEAFVRIMALAHQVMGGVSIMEEYDMPLYSKRTLGWQSSFGDAIHHREQIARELGI